MINFSTSAHRMLFTYAVPSNLNYFWNFGIYSLITLFIQLITGIFLAMHYIPSIDFAFLSIEHIMRDVQNGWLLRYVHANGASMFFIVVYIHVLRGLYYGSFVSPRNFLWLIGGIMLVCMIIVAFLGYVLPWGQMSFWAATVITNLVSVVPVLGPDLVVWLWGGYSVGQPTLGRFFSLHYLLAFVLLMLTVCHIIFLHNVGSNNPFSVEASKDSVPIYPYYYIKDILGVLLFFIFFCSFLFFGPNYLGHTDNYIMANPLVTPSHIVPEWYFLPFYAVLRSIPDKYYGVVSMGQMLLFLITLPNSYTSFFLNNLEFQPISRICFWFFVYSLGLLGWAGMQSTDWPYDMCSAIGMTLYFTHLVYVIPFFCLLETFAWELRYYSPNFLMFLNSFSPKEGLFLFKN